MSISDEEAHHRGTDSYLNNTKLRNHIEAGMDITLARCACVCDKKLHLIIGFQPWLDAIKELNIDLQAECCNITQNLRL